MLYVLRRCKPVQFRRVYLLLCALFFACGSKHLAAALLPAYPVMLALYTLFKVLTACLTVATVLTFCRLLPHILFILSHEPLSRVIKQRLHLQRQVADGESRYTLLSERMHSLLEAIPDAILFKDAQGNLLLANQQARKLIQTTHKNWQQLQQADADNQHSFFADDTTVWNAGYLIMFEDHFLNEDGETVEFEVRKTPVYAEDGQPKAMVVIARDISGMKRVEQELRIAETVIESQEGIIITDKNNVILRVNGAFTRLTGYSSAEVVGKRPSILKSGRHDKNFYREMWSTLGRDKFWQGEIWDRRKNGDIYPKWLTINVVTDANGHVSNYVAAFTDISRHKEAQEAIQRLALFDPLTDLPNRRLLQDKLQQSLLNCKYHLQYGVLMMIDVDNFKTVNDSFGHHVGDQLLIEVGRRLKACIRHADTVARFGGDEFIILLENMGDNAIKAAANAEELGRKILAAINTPIVLEQQEHVVSVSIGINLFEQRNDSFDQILRHADAALYQAKDAGRDTLRFFDPQMQELQLSRQRLECDLRHALALKQLILYYQPQVDKAGDVLGAEVLLRWQHSDRGLVSPAEFIPLAEASGLIISIGTWVIKTACEQLKAWEKYPLTNPLLLAVNVSARQFRQPDFVECISAILHSTGVMPSKLKLELTESLVLDNVSDTIEKMEALKRLGVRFSMDDFGTGYSSLSYLKKLPLSQLKIDQSFVRDIIVDQHDTVIAQTIVGMGHNLGLNVIAEGVETEEQLACLKRIGCDAFQGYLFGKPVPLQQFEELVEDYHVSALLK